MEWFCKFLLFLEVIHVYGFVFSQIKGRKYNGSFVYKIYSSIFRFGVRHTNYSGIVAFIIQGRDILTVHQEFSVMHLVFL